MRTLLLIFACKKPNKYADTGGKGSKNGQILRTSFMDCPSSNSIWLIIIWNLIITFFLGKAYALLQSHLKSFKWLKQHNQIRTAVNFARCSARIGKDQCLVLSPLLFLIYINDIVFNHNCRSDCLGFSAVSFILFADDTILFVRSFAIPWPFRGRSHIT